MPNSDEKKPKPPPWRHSDAKKQLAKDILDGKTDDKDPKQVHEMRAEYTEYKLANFRTNFKNLQTSLSTLQDRADDDEAAFIHDEGLNLRANNKPYPRWGGTEAEKLLQEDIDNGRNLTMKPRELQATRAEYSAYPLKVFRDHVQQEIRSRRERPYWMARKREKEEKKKRKGQKRT
jgi:hypothetical protein